MSTNNYITTLLNLKDPNLKFFDAAEEMVKGVATIVIQAAEIGDGSLSPFGFLLFS